MPLVHFKNFFGPGTLCFADAAPEARTPIPEKVTCRECLSLMGRTAWSSDDDEVALSGLVEARGRRT